MRQSYYRLQRELRESAEERQAQDARDAAELQLPTWPWPLENLFDVHLRDGYDDTVVMSVTKGSDVAQRTMPNTPQTYAFAVSTARNALYGLFDYRKETYGNHIR